MVRRIALGVVVVAVLVAAAAYAFRRPILMGLVESVIAQNLGESLLDELRDDALHLIMCGAGSPLPDPMRSGPCAVVVAGEHVWMVDAGAGASRMLARLRIPQGEVDGVLLTHFHSDHIDGLGELGMQRWVGSASEEPLPLHGPTGIRSITDGLRSAYHFDSQYRTAHHGEEIAPPNGAGFSPEPHRLPPNVPLKDLFRVGDLTVSGIRVDHEPVHPAFGYRFDYKGRNFVISGDTKKSEAVWAAAYKTDVLIHEALAPHLVARLTEAAERARRPRIAKISRDILDYHTTPVEAAEIAQRAEVKHLIFHHIVPPLPLRAMEEIFVEGVDDVYDGPFTVARDGLILTLPLDSDEVEIDFLL